MQRILFLFSILFFLCLSIQKSFAQGNLQFNQVISDAGSASSGVLTVPTGKVWKLEGFFNNTLSADYNIEINGIRVVTNTSYQGYANQGVLWLKAGDTFKIYANPAVNPKGWVYSIIEFNIIP